jgi:hypothetical protein
MSKDMTDLTSNLQWPYYPNQQPNTNINWWFGSLQQWDLDKIRSIMAEEIQKALAEPEEETRPSATIDCMIEGKRYKGTVYLVEEAEDES